MTAPTLFAEKDLTANPAPLGLMGFGMTTVLLNLHNLGLFGNSAMILAMGIFYGGIAQVIAGILEWKKGNTFGTTAFTSYGCFWLSLVGLLVLPKLGWAEAASSSAMGAYLLMWGIFTAFLFVGTLKMDKVSQFVFGSLTVLFALLALGDFTEIAVIKQIAGVVGIACGSAAIYAAMAQVLNEVYGKTVLSVGGKSH
ncbi:acetate uptake transporter [Deefgea tanakiae]|uniref:Acetate uptake transporter n=1 Tax=Deefgea tanakiae TaxID=2865840 RepID=A0ABX8Z8D2_9NEIS|nr:acetate uptake transporter [Deefgea tanakiae]QZA78572.1 acetate uptake transporter [Deefgea tanakiae]